MEILGNIEASTVGLQACSRVKSRDPGGKSKEFWVKITGNMEGSGLESWARSQRIGGRN